MAGYGINVQLHRSTRSLPLGCSCERWEKSVLNRTKEKSGCLLQAMGVQCRVKLAIMRGLDRPRQNHLPQQDVLVVLAGGTH